MSGSLKIPAPCKINLHLRVGKLRADGYHDLESLFAAVDFGDTLEFEVLKDPGICEILTDWPSASVPIPPSKNIVYKAVSLFRARTGFDRGLRIRLEKRVPLGGGLGGGSSDAAAALKALNLLADTGLDTGDLREMALNLGSDVPFFLGGGAALVSGRGERIEPLPVPAGLQVLLVNPGFPSPTAGSFRRLDQWREGNGGLPGPDLSRAGLIAALAKDPPETWPYTNDFLPLFLAGGGEEAGAYRRLLSSLREEGADFAGLSGAGSTCFGIFKGRETAEKALQALSKRWNMVYLTFFLASQ
ncbi:MAG: 4-(cytidine 5'-diphospho)-2-C-methyl-D-erythritol kinase [Treponema sp.]|jgi:4-diphosphocytidyl-2-C-methyl-D-erythritol kinase|nr:4-(cytidine 5'-diphospho)-2-C-methyl-D-erythritol kinase [Treponema sp.]